MATATEMSDSFLGSIRKDPYDEATRYAFADWLEENGHDEEAAIQREWSPEAMRGAEEFLKGYAEDLSFDPGTADGDLRQCYGDYVEPSLVALLEAGHRWLDDAEYFCFNGYSVPREACENIDAFWKAFRTITGRCIPRDKRTSFFTCSC